ncbi:MAG TPA: hypothetical protein VH592_22195 [Gemmataceae bacterium]|jgi:hypothetical protein
MKLAAGRLILTAALFLGWLGYLSYLVVCRPHTPDGLRGAFEGRPLTLSRPQFLVSTLDVVAEVSGQKGEKVIVKEVLFPKANAPVKAGNEIYVENIESCQPPSDPLAKEKDPPPDYIGPGEYLLPLQSPDTEGANRFKVVPTPPSPGFPLSQGAHSGPPRLYPATPQMLAEYGEIKKP